MNIQEGTKKISNMRAGITDLKGIYLQIFGMLDFTTLEGTDRTENIDGMCRQALEWKAQLPGGRHPAALCVWPVFARQVSTALQGSGIRTACVAGGFPSGQSPLDLRLQEVGYALDTGAEEIDMVISRGRMLAGDEDYVRKEVRAFSELCQEKALLKVILETGELKEEELIRRASRIALEEGADFLKTSTGKIQPGATPEAFLWMLEEINTFWKETGRAAGIKAAGGIGTTEDALNYFLLTQWVLGDDWLVPSRLRFGASRLASALIDAIVRS